MQNHVSGLPLQSAARWNGRVNAGQPQLYGTQFTVTDGEIGPSPIEDRQRLDERRAEAGLEPFADYEARMRERS